MYEEASTHGHGYGWTAETGSHLAQVLDSRGVGGGAVEQEQVSKTADGGNRAQIGRKHM